MTCDVWYIKLKSFGLPDDLAIPASYDFTEAGLNAEQYTNILQLRDDLNAMLFEDWVEKINQWIVQSQLDIVLIAGGGVLAALSGLFPQNYQKLSKIAGLGLLGFGAIGAVYKLYKIAFPNQVS